jgi:hypothetical protein
VHLCIYAELPTPDVYLLTLIISDPSKSNKIDFLRRTDNVALAFACVVDYTAGAVSELFTVPFSMSC